MSDGQNSDLLVFRAFLDEYASDDWTRDLARLYGNYTRLDAGQPGLPSWSSREAERRMSDAFRLVVASSALAAVDPELSSKGYRRAGEILEWLSPAMPDDVVGKVLTLAAGSYQVAGFPARASALLSESPASVLGALLSADFDSVMMELSKYWSVGLTDHNTSSEDDIDYAHVLQLEASRVFGAVSAYARWGLGRKELALVREKADAIRCLLQYSSQPMDGIEAALSFDAMERFSGRLLREQLRPFKRALSNEGKRATERYCRLLYRLRRSIAWPIQVQGIERILAPGSFAVFAPTGAGKTAVAELAVLHTLFGRECKPDGMILYITPSRALAREVEQKLTRTLETVCSKPVSVTTLYGGAEWTPENVEVGSTPNVLICTYEKAEALNRHLGDAWRSRIQLVIVDEGHVVALGDTDVALASGGSRPLRLESLVSRLRDQLRHSARFVLLSAVAEGAKTQLQSWIAQSGEESFIDIGQRSMRQVVGRLELRTNGDSTFHYDVLDGHALSIEENNRRPFVENPVPRCVVPEAWREQDKRARLFWVAVHLAKSKNGRSESVLISVPQHIDTYARVFAEFLEDEYWSSRLPAFSGAAATSPRRELWQRCLEVCADYFGDGSSEYRLLERGVIVHHGKMPGRLAGLLVELISSGEVRVVLATSTLSEGVNLPFRTVLIPALTRVQTRMTVREFANLVGRAGRPGQAAEGRALVVMTSAEMAQHYNRLRRDYLELVNEYIDSAHSEPSSPLLLLMRLLRAQWQNDFGAGSVTFEEWLETTAPRAASEGVVEAEKTLSVLDGTLLAVLVETEAEQERGVAVEEILARVWRGTFAGVISGVSSESSLFVARGRSLPSLIPDAAVRKKVYASGVRPTSSLQLLGLQDEMLGQLRRGANYAEMGASDRLAWIIDIAGRLAVVDEFRLPPLRQRSKTTWEQILHWWMSRDTATAKPTEKQVANWIAFVSKRFVYGTSWGLSCVLSMSAIGLSPTPSGLEATLTSLRLPWLSLWVPLMLKWGTLEPAAAWLLETNRATTRAEAEKRAREFGELVEEIGEDPYEFSLIRAWAQEQSKATEQHRPTKGRLASDVEMHKNLPDHQRYRVLPVLREGRLLWTDPAGYVLASSRAPDDWQEDERIVDRDYSLNPGKRRVVWRAYIG